MLRKRAYKRPDERGQSAMEYLMTYAWAILIIAIIFAALFAYLIFNPYTFEPRVQPGGCQVSKPLGPGTTNLASLTPGCNDDLPQYVMNSKGIGDFVNVLGSDVYSSPLNILGSNITITAWVYINGAPYHDIVDKENQYGMKIDHNNQPHQCTSPTNSVGWCLEWDTYGAWNGTSFLIPNATTGRWIFIAVSQGGDMKYWYANNAEIGNLSGAKPIKYVDSNFTIGAISPGYSGYGEAEWFNGSIANVQIYNVSLPKSDIATIYHEGIGGAPIDLQDLVGWWPLNGNANDYSGNNDNGKIFNNSFSQSWLVNYPPP
jgi:hypothetical protein